MPGINLWKRLNRPGSKDGAHSRPHCKSSAQPRLTRTASTEEKEETVSIAFLLPVIITASPLFEAALNPATNRVEAAPVSRSAVAVHLGALDQVIVTVVNEHALESLIGDLLPIKREVSTFLDMFQISG